MVKFMFQKLAVYQRALLFTGAAEGLVKAQLASTNGTLGDRLSRAALATALSIAEGAGLWYARDRRQAYAAARASVFECVAILEVLLQQDLLNPEVYNKLEDELLIIAKMLTKLMQYEEARMAAAAAGATPVGAGTSAVH